MTKVLRHTAMSLDGFVAAPNDDLSWRTCTGGPAPVDDVLVQVLARADPEPDWSLAHHGNRRRLLSHDRRVVNEIVGQVTCETSSISLDCATSAPSTLHA